MHVNYTKVALKLHIHTHACKKNTYSLIHPPNILRRGTGTQVGGDSHIRGRHRGGSVAVCISVAGSGVPVVVQVNVCGNVRVCVVHVCACVLGGGGAFMCVNLVLIG